MLGLKHILYFADGEFGPTDALRRAIDLAVRHDARLTLMDVTIESDIAAELVRRYGLTDDVQQSEQRYAALCRLADDYVRPLTPRLRVTIGSPFIEVIQAVIRDGHDLVIKPARMRPGSPDRLFASVDMHLLRKCPCPVWIAREHGEPGPEAVPQTRCRAVLAAVDPVEPRSAELNRRIMEAASAVAASDGAALDVVHAWQPPFAGQRGTESAQADRLREAAGQIEEQHARALDALLEPYRGRMGHRQARLTRGRPSEQILQQARNLGTDLLVMATLSRPREPGFFIGTTAEDVLQGCPVSVLALKPEGFRSPVEPGR